MGDAADANQGADVTVVIPCHDVARIDGVRAAVQSIRAQTSPPRRIVVTVDHSPELARQLRELEPDVVIVENITGDRGASENRNRGAQDVDTELLLFMDGDETAESTWLAELVGPLRQRQVVGTGGRVVAAWESGRPDWFPPGFGWTVGTHDEATPSGRVPVRNVWSGNMALRTETFRRIGGFRVGFGKIGEVAQPEDTDLCIRASALEGGSWLFVPSAVTYHAVPHGRHSFSNFVRRCYGEGRGKIMLRGLYAPDARQRVLDAEDTYLRSVVPGVVRAEMRGLGQHASRLGAIAVGLGFAGVGAASGLAHQARADAGARRVRRTQG
ncbi:MAG: glycosyltransferase [Dermatophilaceae bacterium]